MGEEKSRDGQREGSRARMAGERGEEPNGERVKSMAEGEMREVGKEGLKG